MRAIADKEKFLSICFGHQLIAHFFGGHVAPAPVGWAVGCNSDLVKTTLGWEVAGKPQKQLHFEYSQSQKDQVERLPDGAEVFARSDFCPISGLPLAMKVLTIQGHPELSTEYSEAARIVGRKCLSKRYGKPAAANRREAIHSVDAGVLRDSSAATTEPIESSARG